MGKIALNCDQGYLDKFILKRVNKCKSLNQYSSLYSRNRIESTRVDFLAEQFSTCCVLAVWKITFAWGQFLLICWYVCGLNLHKNIFLNGIFFIICSNFIIIDWTNGQLQFGILMLLLLLLFRIAALQSTRCYTIPFKTIMLCVCWLDVY